MTGLSRRTLLRGLLTSAAACSTLAFAQRGWAGSYLTRVAMLVDGAHRDADQLRRRPHDKELARVAHAVAAARVRAATSMQVPPEVVQAHPHVGLTLENYERCADAAAQGRAERFVTYFLKAREEEATLRVVLEQLGWKLPQE